MHYNIRRIAITIGLLITGIKFMEAGMEEEVLKGLMSSAYTYKDIGVNVTYREAGDNEIESMLKSETGYDFTWFEGDTRKNSSLGSSVIGTKAADAVINSCCSISLHRNGWSYIRDQQEHQASCQR